MKRLALTLVATVGLAGVLTTVSSGGPPPPLLAHIAVTHARPIAGHRFVGVTVTKATAGIENVICPARVGATNLRALKERYYDGDFGVVAVSCSWHVPLTAHGRLQAGVTVITSNGTLEGARDTLSWRIKR